MHNNVRRPSFRVSVFGVRSPFSLRKGATRYSEIGKEPAAALVQLFSNDLLLIGSSSDY